MGTLTAVLHTELRMMRRTRGLWAATGLFILLAALAGWAGGDRVRDMRGAIETARLAEARAITMYRGQSEAALSAGVLVPDPRVPGRLRLAPGAAYGTAHEGADPGAVGLRRFSRTVALEPAPLAAFSVGVSDLRPMLLALTARQPHVVFQVQPELENPAAQGIGPFDMTFVVVFLLPLLILAASYDVLVHDRASGLEAMALAQGIGRGPYILGQLAARCGWTAISVIVGGLAGLLSSGAAANVAAWPAFLHWLAVALAYGAFWLALALAVNLCVRSAASSAALLAGLWLLVVAIVPPVVGALAESLHPPPSRLALTATLRGLSAETERSTAAALDAFLFEHPETVGGSGRESFYLRLMAREAAVEKAAAPLIAAFSTAQTARSTLMSRLDWLSPALLARSAFDRLAGTDEARHDTFLAEARRAHADWLAFFKARVIEGAALSPSDYDTVFRTSVPKSSGTIPMLGPG